MKKLLIPFVTFLVGVAITLSFNLKKTHNFFNIFRKATDSSHISKSHHAITKNLLSKYPVTDKKAFVVVIASYNNEAVCERNLFSVFDQTFENYRVIYIDDCSTDRTYEKVKNFINERNQEKRVTLIHNEKRKLKLANLYQAYISCKDDEIIVCLDGDDWLAHQNVLKELNDYYQNPDIWITYGSAINHPKYVKKDGSCLSDKDLLKNRIRDVPFNISMIRTFYAGLFKKIKLKDLLYQGKFLPSADDFAFMIPMIEMAPTHALFIPEVLYIINDSNPIRESSVIENLQVKLMKHLKLKEKYKALDVTFNPRNLTTLEMQKPIDLIILSNNSPNLLTINLDNLASKISPLNTIYVYYRATTSAHHKAYQDLITNYPTITFILDSEMSIKELIENASSYVALSVDSFSLERPINALNCIKEMELTGSVNFFFSQIPTDSNTLLLKESLVALSLDSAVKIPQLLTDSFFIITQKDFLMNSIDSESPFCDLIKSLCVKERNLSETALLFTSQKSKDY